MMVKLTHGVNFYNKIFDYICHSKFKGWKGKTWTNNDINFIFDEIVINIFSNEFELMNDVHVLCNRIGLILSKNGSKSGLTGGYHLNS